MSMTATVTAATLNVRASGSSTASLLGRLARGAHVDVLAREGDWYRVASGALVGFVHGDYLRLASTPTADGFLCRDDALCAPTLPLAPAQPILPVGAGPVAEQAAKAWNRYGGVLAPLCSATGISRASAVGVLCVESSGQGMTDAGQLIIRFETHVFFDRWGKSHESEFRDHFTFDPAKRWTKQRYRASSTDAWNGLHGVGQAAEWAAFSIARALDEPAAMLSISMGAPQIMGFNHATIGYDSAREMFDRFTADERYHILGLFDFVKGGGPTSRMLEALKRGQYEQFATFYNGHGQEVAYGAKIRAAADAFASIAEH
ncbi:MAG: N-acetylmuramidase domain-containing protein [Gemmatimonadaceae bacterium]